MYDTIIVGGGPGGVSAGIYAARKKMKALLITDSFGGQSIVSDDIQNWVGTKSISGLELAKALEEHLRAYDGIEIVDDDRVAMVSKLEGGFRVKTNKGREYETRTLVLSSGSRRRRMGVPGEDKFDGKGVAFCATCDAPLFKGKVVAVVGGGNAGLETVIDLLPYAEKIYLLERGEMLRGDAVTQDKVKASLKVELITKAEVQEVLGDSFVNGLRYKDTRTGEIKKLELQGVFVEIGAVPNSDFVKDVVELDKFGAIVVDARTMMSKTPGIWAVGDVCDTPYKQNNIAAGDAVKAILNIGEYLAK